MPVDGTTEKKRKEPSSDPFKFSESNIIDLTFSDDEAQPPPKRQKSTTPIERNGLPAKNVSLGQSHVIELRSLPLPLDNSPQNRKPEAHKDEVLSTPKPEKRSPWRSRPSWAPGNLEQIQSTIERSASPLAHVIDRVNGKTAGTFTISNKNKADVVSLSASESNDSGTNARSASSSDRQSHTKNARRLKSSFSSPKSIDGRYVPVKSHQQSSRDILKNTSTATPRSSQNIIITIPRRVSTQPAPGYSTANPPIRSATPKSSGREVQTPNPRSYASPEDLLAQFTADVPDPADGRAEKRMLWHELKQNAEPIKTKLDLIEKYFGHNGFSEIYSTVDDTRRLKRLAQKKVRKVKRKDVALDFGEPFIPDPSDSGSPTHPHGQVRAILHSKFDKQVFPPLTFSNEINTNQLNGKFQFISGYILRDKVYRTEPDFKLGCRCVGFCNRTSCDCLERDVDTGEVIETYTRRPDGRVVLTERYLEEFSMRSEITECNQGCGCDRRCLNRVVQNGRTVPLDIFQTVKCGFGVRSSLSIVRGQFIELYLGEIVTQAALQFREEAKAEGASSYIFSLDWWNDTQLDHNHVDGENFGSALRFVNHSCNPNSRSFTVRLEHRADKKIYYVAFFAIRDIQAGEEITIDYNPQLAKDHTGILRNLDAEVDGENDSQEGDIIVMDENDVRCQCGAPNCRIRLWPKARTQRKRRRRIRD